MALSFRNHADHANVAVEGNAESISPELNQMVLDLLLVDLRHADDPDEDGHTDAVAMRKILSTMKVTGMDNLRNVLNVRQIQSPAFINSVQPALEWLTVLAKWQLLDIEETPEDFDEMKHEVAARYTHVAHNWPTPAALTHWGPGTNQSNVSSLHLSSRSDNFSATMEIGWNGASRVSGILQPRTSSR